MSELIGRIARINALENGKGLQHLLNEAYKIFGNPAILFNMEYELIACTENVVTDDFLWNELVENGVFSSETIYFFKKEAFHDTAASSKAIALLTSDNLKYDRFYGRVLNSDNSTVIDLIVIACFEPFCDEDPEAVEALRMKLSKEISAIEYYWQYGVFYHQNLIQNLIDKHFDDRIIFSDHVANLYEGLKTNLYVVVADVGKCSSANKSPEYFRDLFKKTQAEFKYAVYSDYIVIIVSTEEAALNINRDLSKLVLLFEDNNLYAGISGRFENLFDIREHYNEAVDSLKQGLDAGHSGRVFPYDDIASVNKHGNSA